MTVLSVDPGRGSKASIGWCLFTATGEEMERGETNWDGLVLRLRNHRHSLTYLGYSLSAVVVENFVNDPRVKRGGQTNGASEVIGAIEFMCAQTDTPFYRQDRSELPAAKMQAQYVDTHKHLPHADAAFLHGWHWLVGQGIVEAVGIRDTLGVDATLE